MRSVFNRFAAAALLITVIHVESAVAASRPGGRPPFSVDGWIAQYIERILTILGDTLTVPGG